jgi:hypothetical protein
MAKQSITATTGATIIGRLLANTAAVTLDTNTITVPTGCPAAGTTSTSPVITSRAPTGATAGTPYEFTVTATGTPAPTYTISSGALPAGLTLNGTTGVISGTPTTPGTTTFTVTASNRTAPDSAATHTLVTAAPAASGSGSGPNATGTNGLELAESGSDQVALATAALLTLAAGSLLVIARRRRRQHSR